MHKSLYTSSYTSLFTNSSQNSYLDEPPDRLAQFIVFVEEVEKQRVADKRLRAPVQLLDHGLPLGGVRDVRGEL